MLIVRAAGLCAMCSKNVEQEKLLEQEQCSVAHCVCHVMLPGARRVRGGSAGPAVGSPGAAESNAGALSPVPCCAGLGSRLPSLAANQVLHRPLVGAAGLSIGLAAVCIPSSSSAFCCTCCTFKVFTDGR